MPQLSRVVSRDRATASRSSGIERWPARCVASNRRVQRAVVCVVLQHRRWDATNHSGARACRSRAAGQSRTGGRIAGSVMTGFGLLGVVQRREVRAASRPRASAMPSAADRRGDAAGLDRDARGSGSRPDRQREPSRATRTAPADQVARVAPAGVRGRRPSSRCPSRRPAIRACAC